MRTSFWYQAIAKQPQATSSVMGHIRLATCGFADAAMGPCEFLALPTWLEPAKLLGSKYFDTTFDAASHVRIIHSEFL